MTHNYVSCTHFHKYKGKTSRYYWYHKKFSASGNRTPVSRVTGGDTHHYTNVELTRPCPGLFIKLFLAVQRAKKNRWLWWIIKFNVLTDLEMTSKWPCVTLTNWHDPFLDNEPKNIQKSFWCLIILIFNLITSRVNIIMNILISFQLNKRHHLCRTCLCSVRGPRSRKE